MLWSGIEAAVAIDRKRSQASESEQVRLNKLFSLKIDLYRVLFRKRSLFSSTTKADTLTNHIFTLPIYLRLFSADMIK